MILYTQYYQKDNIEFKSFIFYPVFRGFKKMSHASNRVLPKQPWSREAINQYLDELVAMDPDYTHGAMTCYCMKGSEDKQKVLEESYLKFFHQNGVVRRMMPGVQELEASMHAICADILGGGKPGVAVNFTSGGSESIFCGLHAAREWAREKYPDITAPEVVAPYSAHPAFSKGCHYLGLKLVRVPLASNRRADVQAMEAAITKNTICLVGSAPCWPYGLYDPIRQLGELAEGRDLWMHVDACVGGYLAPFVKKAGYDVPEWDFNLPGVMSISADVHKYGYAAKSLSTVGWRSSDLQKYHHFSPDDWPSSQYITEGFIGSRSVGPLSGAWGVMHYLGEEGYVNYARQSMKNKERILTGVAEIDGLAPFESELCLTYFYSEDENLKIENIIGGLSEKGWANFGTLEPPLVQLIVDPFPDDSPIIDMYLRDLRAVVDDIRSGVNVKVGNLLYAD